MAAVTGAAGHVSRTLAGSPQPLAIDESRSEDGPRFLGAEEEETSWLASHKYMVAAIVIAVAILLGLLLAR